MALNLITRVEKKLKVFKRAPPYKTGTKLVGDTRALRDDVM